MEHERLTRKKEQLDEYRSLPKALSLNLSEWLRVELTYTSNAIEGNTLTRSETALIVQEGLAVGGKSLVEHLEARNHAVALDWVREQSDREVRSIVERDVLHIHGIILKGIDDVSAGSYRSAPVRVAGSAFVFPNYRKVPELMPEFIAFLKQAADMHPVQLAAEAHYRLVTIHPFLDGNGRTARLLMNMILLMKGYPEAVIRKRDRLNYIKALEKAQMSESMDDYFKLISISVERSLDMYLEAAKGRENKWYDEERLLKIGELAKQTGENNSTIRHWMKEGLLAVADTTESGYQLYDYDMIERIGKIQALKKKRYTLKEIKELID